MVNLLKYNFHWKSDFAYGYAKKRDLFHALVRQIDNAQIIGIVGLRRTGKTVILKQLIDHLIEHDHPRDRIIYYSFDDEVVPLQEIFRDFTSRVGVDVSSAGKLHVFLDEIQKLDNWQNQIKYYYDTHPGVKFYVSGSSSIFLKKKAEESLAGRIFLFHLPVLSFREFLLFKGEGRLLENPELVKEELMQQVELYVKRQLPELVTASEDFVRMYVESIINKVVFEDLPKVFPIEYEDVLKRIIKVVASSPGIVTDYDAMSSELGLSRKTLSNYISYLERSFLIQKCYNFSRNRLTSEKKMKKLYVTSTTFLFALGDGQDYGRTIENLVINASGARFFWRKGRNEVDAVLEKNNLLLPVESKYKSNILEKELKGVIKFMEKFNVERGYVVTKDLEAEREPRGKKITLLPLWKWLLRYP